MQFQQGPSTSSGNTTRCRNRNCSFDHPQIRSTKKVQKESQTVTELLEKASQFLAKRDYTGAARAYRQALQIDPDSVETHYRLAHLLLELGKWKEGFVEYEWRRRRSTTHLKQYSLPNWRGQPLDGTLLVQCEQGLGDSIQFARYLPLIQKRVGKIALVCQPALLELFHYFTPQIQLLSDGESIGGIEAWTPLLSLPRIFETMPDFVPAPIPYVPLAQKSSDEKRNFKIGIVWRTNKPSITQQRKSVTLQQLLPLSEAKGVEWISLQKEMTEEEIQLFRREFSADQCPERLSDFFDTARAIAELDLVITIDSAVAHLAGSIGVKTWAMLSYFCDWRWLLERSDSPWYPSMTLFRCEQPEELAGWNRMIERIAKETKLLTQRG